jgi:RNA polymerase sigma-70 factor (ECF subfamily)
VSSDSLPAWQGVTDEQLVAGSRQGDKDAFGELVRRYQGLAVGIAFRMTGDGMLAEDAAQDAFLRAWQRLSSFQTRGPGSFRAWLCRIVTNATIDRLRKARPTVPLEGIPLTGSSSLSDTYLRQEKAEEVRAAILRLPEASRVTLILREYEGLSYREIADALDIPIGTVMSRLNYARTKLRGELASRPAIGEEDR